MVLGGLVAFLLAAVPGNPAIMLLRRLNMRQNISADAPQAHSAKQGTPTMGGLLVLFAVTLPVVGYVLLTQIGAHRRPAQDYTLLALVALTLAFGAIGFLDDYLSAKRGKNLGLRAREKFAAQIGVAILFVVWVARTAQPDVTTVVWIAPGTLTGPIAVDLGRWYFVLAVPFIVGLSNATNFTDGLDGLSSGVTCLICIALAALIRFSELGSPSGLSSLAFYPIALAGALAGFLWWNAHPARVFMGDTGALALGAGLAGVAMLSKQEVGLIVASLVCWAELFSVMIQVTVFKWRRRTHGLEYAQQHRVFRRAPLHHHFEEIGWRETQVVTRFWIVGGICGALALLWMRS
jgi:phospho-N-acetylmuramoyl-pentapeptide-transferase